MTFFLTLVIAAIVLGIIGVVAEGLFYLLIIGIVVLVAALVHLGMHIRRSGRHQRKVR
jgi:sterol desaturase/sphingolipid hydroxylase (fatty acid hydroxylase superfamily)